MKARVFYLPLAVIFVVLWLYAARAESHRLSGHPKTLERKLAQAKRQVVHDRQVVSQETHHAHWLLLSPLPWEAFLHRSWLTADRRYVRELERLLSPAAVICRVFGPYCSQALRVASCESHLDVGAVNGQYLGLFQMGSYARGRYGHGPDAWSQARAAYRYFVASGRGWGPWECRP